MKILSLSVLTGYMLLVFGCASAPTKSTIKPHNQSVNPYVSPLERVETLDKLRAEHTKMPEAGNYSRLIEGYRKVLEASPNYFPALRGLYSTYYFAAQAPTTLAHSKQLAIASLESLYPKFPPLIRQEFFPPAFAEYQHHVNLATQNGSKISEQELLRHLRTALIQSPNNSTVRAIYAENLEKLGMQEIAIAVLKEASIQQPDESIYLHTLANILYKTAVYGECAQDNVAELKSVLSYYRKTLELDANADVHYEMGLLYGLMGLQPLMLNEAARVEEKEDLSSLWQAGYLYTRTGHFDKAERVFKRANNLASVKDAPQGRAYIDYLMLTDQWLLAADYFPNYLRQKYSVNSYDALIAGLIWSAANGEENKMSFQSVWPQSINLAQKYEWPTTLLNLTLGEADPRALLAEVANSCDRVQVHFYAGLRAITNKDAKLAKEHAKEVIDTALPMSLEVLLANSLLQARAQKMLADK